MPRAGPGLRQDPEAANEGKAAWERVEFIPPQFAGSIEGKLARDAIEAKRAELAFGSLIERQQYSSVNFNETAYEPLQLHDASALLRDGLRG